jgi:hypothetical protein
LRLVSTNARRSRQGCRCKFGIDVQQAKETVHTSRRKIQMTALSVLTLAMISVGGYPNSSPKNERACAIFFSDPAPTISENAPTRSATISTPCQAATAAETSARRNARGEHVVLTVLIGVPAPVFNGMLIIEVNEVVNDAVTATVKLKSDGSCTLGPAKSGTAYALHGYIIQVDKVSGDGARFIVDSTRPDDVKLLAYQLRIGVGCALLLITFLVVAVFKKHRLTHKQVAILRFLCSICTGLSGALFAGGAVFKMDYAVGAATNIALSGTAGCALFFVGWFTFPKVVSSEGGTTAINERCDEL